MVMVPGDRMQTMIPDTEDMEVLYCSVLYCTVLYCTVLYCTVLYLGEGDTLHQQVDGGHHL